MNRRNALVGGMLAIAAMTMPAAVHAAKVIIINAGPPPERVEVVPAARTGYVWVPGYWRWDRGRHVWVKGHWIRERRGYHWTPHRWHERGKRWHFEAGHWDRG
ncbi:MAG: YXWGXW repeat-containing protein [Pseudomonadota bacterium]|nr:YXWGXW repeat-containing protein [Pseudomonadota bacterium]